MKKKTTTNEQSGCALPRKGTQLVEGIPTGARHLSVSQLCGAEGTGAAAQRPLQLSFHFHVAYTAAEVSDIRHTAAQKAHRPAEITCAKEGWKEMCAAVYVLSTVTGYVLTSALLLKCPTLLHRRKRERFLSQHISHRGGAGENLENTMAAFKHAVDLGTDMLELDCHMTKDEQVVVSHDANLRRVCGINADISNVAYAELPPYLCKLGVTFQKECFCEGGEDKRIPLLRDVFDAFPNTPINIDIKVNNDTLIRKVSELVVKYDREHLTVWGNASNQIVKKCYKENPHIPVLFSLPKVLQLLGLFYTGLLPFVPLKEQFLEIPMPSIITKLKDPDRLTRSQRFVAWLADSLLMRKALFQHLTARGIQVYIWVLNDEEDFQRAFDLGATGVMTDFPTRLKDFMDKNGISKSQ
ncbi:lysophospholipase D GDPD1 [Menidia menidia]